MPKSTVTTVASLAKSLKMSPKVARGKLRRAGWKPTKDGWSFPTARAAEARKVLTA